MNSGPTLERVSGEEYKSLRDEILELQRYGRSVIRLGVYGVVGIAGLLLVNVPQLSAFLAVRGSAVPDLWASAIHLLIYSIGIAALGLTARIYYLAVDHSHREAAYLTVFHDTRLVAHQPAFGWHYWNRFEKYCQQRQLLSTPPRDRRYSVQMGTEFILSYMLAMAILVASANVAHWLLSGPPLKEVLMTLSRGPKPGELWPAVVVELRRARSYYLLVTVLMGVSLTYYIIYLARSLEIRMHRWTWQWFEVARLPTSEHDLFWSYQGVRGDEGKNAACSV